MSFAFPAAGLLLLVAPVVVALYLRRVRPQEQTFSSLLFWEQAIRQNARAHWWGRLRAWLSLLLQLLILLLLILALAKPEWGTRSESARILVIDTRGRMLATDSLNQSVFSKALRYAAGIAESARENAPTALITAGSSPKIVSPFSDDPQALRESLQKLQATPGGGDLDAAVQLARSLADARGPGTEVQVLTDRPGDQAQARVLTFGQASENMGFTAAGARTSHGSAAISLQATSHASESRETHIDLEQNGRLLDTRPLRLEPNIPVDLHFDPPLREGPFTARLRADDALAADQQIELALPLTPPRKVLLVSPGNWFLERALRADDTVQFELLQPGEWNPAISSAFDLTIFDGAVPKDFTEKGHFLFLATAPGINAARLTHPAVVGADTTHPLLRNLRPEQWVIGEQAGVPTGSDFTGIVTGTQGPLVIARETADTRWAALLFAPEKTDLPLRPSFPILLQNLVDWTTQTTGEGSIVTAPLDADGSDLRPTQSSPLPTSERWGIPSLWRGLTLAAFALLLVEWATYHRRITE